MDENIEMKNIADDEETSSLLLDQNEQIQILRKNYSKKFRVPCKLNL